MIEFVMSKRSKKSGEWFLLTIQIFIQDCRTKDIFRYKLMIKALISPKRIK
jgi:hypothetical protein